MAKKVLVRRISTGYNILFYDGNTLVGEIFDTVYAKEEPEIPEGFEGYIEWTYDIHGAEYENRTYFSPEQTT